MAKSRRRMTRSPRKRERADWVYRDNVYQAAGPFDLLGTYTPRGTTIAAGRIGAAGKILYDSKSYINTTTQGTVGLPLPVSGASRAEGSKAKILAVEGMIFFTPSTWALGSTLLAGFRIGIFEQSPISGNIQVDAQYAMWSEDLDVSSNPAIWANRPFSWERRVFKRFTVGNEQVAWGLPVSFRTKRTLAPSQCFALYVEGADASQGLTGASSVTFVIQPWLRTLVVDEG